MGAGGLEAPQLRAQLEIFPSVSEACLKQPGEKNRGVLQLQPGETVKIIKTKPVISTLCTG